MLKNDADVKPIKATTAKLPPIHQEKAALALTNELLKAGVIRKDDKVTTWVSPARFIPKKDSKKVRLITDFR